jgi:hypothetical protein
LKLMKKKACLTRRLWQAGTWLKLDPLPQPIRSRSRAKPDAPWMRPAEALAYLTKPLL